MAQTTEAPPQPPIFLPRQKKHDLPEDIVLNIQAWLPVKSLLRFRCVSKSWYSHITTPKFMSTHLNNMLCLNDHDHGYVIYMPSSTSLNTQICTLACDLTFEKISEFGFPFSFRSGFADLVGSCNGLLCLTDFRQFYRTLVNDVYLWNPSIRKFKRLSGTCLSQLRHFKLGFVHDSRNNDYKVVRISRPSIRPITSPEVEVYSLSSDSWKRVEVGISMRPNVVLYSFSRALSSPFVSGHLNWMLDTIEEEGGEQQHYSEMILSFDVNSEKLKELPLPNVDSSEEFYSDKYLTSFKGKLAFAKFGPSLQPHVTLCFIWVMREYGVPESWNKLCVLPVRSPPPFIGFTKYGSLLIRTNKKSEREDKFVLVNPKTLHEKDIRVQLNYPLGMASLNVATYVENLALLDGANAISY